MCDVGRISSMQPGMRAGTHDRIGRTVRSDTEIRDDVIDELRWDPQITDPDAIDVAVKDGAVTLTATSRPTRRSWPCPGRGRRGPRGSRPWKATS